MAERTTTILKNCVQLWMAMALMLAVTRVNSQGVPVLDTVQLYQSISLCPTQTFLGTAWPRDTSIRVFAPGAPGADDTLKTFKIDVLAAPVFQINGDSTLCNDDTVRLDAGGFFALYQWSNGATGKTIPVSTPGAYHVTVTAANGCTGARGIQVIASRPDAVVEVQDPACAGAADGSIRLSDFSGGFAPYQTALGNDPPGSDSVFSGLGAGAYRLTLIDATGCTDSLPLMLSDPPPFTIDIGPDRLLYPGDSLRLQTTASGFATRYQWQPAYLFDCDTCPAPLLLRPADALVTLNSWNDAGCAAADTLRLIYRDSLDLYVPNAFAPGRDSENGSLMVFPGPGNWELAEFAVYDRWGNLLFQSAKPVRHPETLVWDGRVRGDLVQPGVLLWAAKLQLPGGAATWRAGDITVVR